MIITQKDMSIEKRENMRGGSGVVEIKTLVGKELLKNARLMAEISIPKGAGIGEHPHEKETEYFIVLSGKGVVNDNGVTKEVSKGDVLITGGGAIHGVKNIDDEELRMIALIIND
jgi:quercetin dioxygenase-like cupin family protein